jgi:Zn-dependent protease with chaperone function
MTPGSPLVAWLAVAAIVGAASVSILVALTLPRLLARLEGSSPARRARVLTALCLAPLAAGVGLAVLCLLPSLYAALWPGLDHCTQHADEHLHLCIFHPPAAVVGSVASLFSLVCIAAVVLRAAPDVLRIHRARRVLARLHDVSEPLPPDLRSVDTDAAFSFTGGLLRPAIYLSRGLRDSLDPAQLAVVVEHERAHLRRHDLLRRLAAQLGALFHGPGTGRALLSATDLACEEACDEEAATRLGDRVQVAKTLVAAARLVPRLPSPLAASVVGFTGDALTHRVENLLRDPHRDPAVSGWIVVGAAIALLALAPALHHTAETILSLVARA